MARPNSELLHLGTMDNGTPEQAIITNGLKKIGTKFYSQRNADYALCQIIIGNVCRENQVMLHHSDTLTIKCSKMADH